MQRKEESKPVLSNKKTAPSSTLFITKTPDPILDIQKTPFDHMQHAIALRKGQYNYSEEKNYIDLRRLHAIDDKPGGGFGTAAFRALVHTSIQLGHLGNIKTDASTSYGSPHLFYLYMGMKPSLGNVNYLITMHGIAGENIATKLESLSKHEEWSTETLKEHFDESSLDDLRMILKDRTLSLENIPNKKNLLLQLEEKKIDYTLDFFIPKLLRILEKSPTDKYPNTNDLHSTKMCLTEKGLARWKFVIDNNLEFVPFKQLEHLDLRPEQKDRLKAILDKRAAATLKP